MSAAFVAHLQDGLAHQGDGFGRTNNLQAENNFILSGPSINRTWLNRFTIIRREVLVYLTSLFWNIGLRDY